MFVVNIKVILALILLLSSIGSVVAKDKYQSSNPIYQNSGLVDLAKMADDGDKNAIQAMCELADDKLAPADLRRYGKKFCKK